MLNIPKYTPDLAELPEAIDGILPISEIFYSLQGEGRFAGQPAIFVRLMYCNLGCAWCDTRYTWDKKKLDVAKNLKIVEIVEQAKLLVKASDRSQVHVVITGGEPLLHQQALGGLIEGLRASNFEFIEIETNGTIAPSAKLLEQISWWNCSPKLSNSGVSRDKYFVVSAIEALLSTEKVDFKFVVSCPEDFEEIEEIFLPYIPRERIILMAEGMSDSKQISAMPWLLNFCKQNAVRYSPRLQVLTFGGIRGV